MTDLVERYVNQVGRLLPKSERAEIELELRSQIEDQLEDRFPEEPSPTQVATVLAEMGDPANIARSYRGDQYLIGPDLYPWMMIVLRHGWVIVPSIVVFLHIFDALIGASRTSLTALVLDPALAAIQAVFFFSSVVVLGFAIIERSHALFTWNDAPFDPLDLPELDDPGSLDRVEAVSGVAVGTVFVLVFLYFLSVGGLTLRFNPSDPGEIVATPASWTIFLIAMGTGQIVLSLLAIRRGRWHLTTWLGQSLMELAGVIGLYFAALRPLFDRLVLENDSLNTPLVSSMPELFVVLYAAIALISKGVVLLQLWNHRSDATSIALPSDR